MYSSIGHRLRVDCRDDRNHDCDEFGFEPWDIYILTFATDFANCDQDCDDFDCGCDDLKVETMGY